MTNTIDRLADTTDPGIAPNAKRLLWAGFLAILATGVGFSIRGGILVNWASDFGFNATQLGAIGAAGFTGFCFGIIIGGVIADKIGYGKLVIAAFIFHILSAVVAFSAHKGQSPDLAFSLLWWGTFIFALGNGTLEAVANPLVSTLFPHNRTHYLNILHASWPAGLVLGALFTWAVGDSLSWQLQLALYLLPVALYGFMFFGQHFPKSEASVKGLPITEMLKDVGLCGSAVACFLLFLFFRDGLNLPAPLGTILGYVIAIGLWLTVGLLTRFSLGSILLLVIFATHALVGAVELGTDGWIQNITGNILSPGQGKLLFVFTSLFMFCLRFCAHFIEKNLKLSPIGLLSICAILACIGLNLVSGINTFIGAIAALSVYALGKTFFWPTMLAVIGDRFPRTGAIAISISGGIGMMSAGLLGSVGLGYAKDRFAAEALQKESPALYAEYKSATPSKFVFFQSVQGLDGARLSEVQKVPAEKQTPDQKSVAQASISGDRQTLKADSCIPATMACIYLALLGYFASIGGYKPINIDPERLAGGIDGPMQA